MFKLLIGLPLLLVGGALALAVALPLFALLPLALALGAGVFALVLVGSLFGAALRLFVGLVFGAGALLVAVLGAGLFFGAGAIILALGVALAHLLVPVLLVVGLVWLIRRASRTTPSALPAPQA